MMPDDFPAYLKVIAAQCGGELFGVADITPARDFIAAQGGQSLAAYPRAVSAGMRLIDSILDQHSPDDRHELSLYWHHVYNVVTPLLDFLAYRVALELQKAGYKALPVPGSMPYNRETWKGVFSHKLAAHLAGLGWIGKSCLLITPEFGPRVRFVTILTDAPLEPGKPINRKCGKCEVCVTSCPVQAFKGREFQPDEPVEMRFDARVCGEYRHTHPCGLCVAGCPAGRRRRPSAKRYLSPADGIKGE
jgi:epoxyqueuosine reductase